MNASVSMGFLQPLDRILGQSLQVMLFSKWSSCQS